MSSGYVVFFDSGIGGLTLMRECYSKLNGETFLYFGDNNNAPYGTKSPRQIEKMAFSAFDYLSRFPIKVAVIACNTVTAECVKKMREKYPFKIVGVEPAIKPASKNCKNVLVIATKATLESKKFNLLFNNLDTHCKFTFHAPVNLVPQIEKNIFNLSRINLSEHIPKGNFDGVVLGCTHYIFMKKQIENYLKIPVFDGNLGTADHLKNILCEISKNSANFNNFNAKKYLFNPLNERDCNAKNAVYFLGKSANFNSRVYSSLF